MFHHIVKPAHRGSLCQWTIALIFLGLTIPAISSPPVGPEEDLEILHGVYLLETPADQVIRTSYVTQSCVEAFGRHWPLMTDNPYVGATEIYLQIPFFKLLGRNAFCLRLVPVLLSLMTLLIMYRLFASWFGVLPAFLSATLAATSPLFVHFSRQGHYTEEIFSIGFLWAGLYWFSRFFEGEEDRLRKLWLAFGALSFGLGFSHKITFIYYALGLLVAGLMLSSGKLRGRFSKVELLIFGGAFLLGAMPIIIYNLRSGGATLDIMLSSLLEPTPKDHIDNLAYPGNLLTRIKQLVWIFLPGKLWEPLWFDYLKEEPLILNHLFTLTFIAGYVSLFFRKFREKAGYGRQSVFFLDLFTVVFLLTPFTVSVIRPMHLSIMFPFPGIVTGLFLAGMYKLIPFRKIGRLVVVVVIGGIVATNVYLSAHYSVQASKNSPTADAWQTLREVRMLETDGAPIIPWKEEGN